MNTNSAKEYLPLILALANGKTIQINTGTGWRDAVEPDFTIDASCYRIKQEPLELTLWVHENGAIQANVPGISVQAMPRFGWRLVRMREIV